MKYLFPNVLSGMRDYRQAVPWRGPGQRGKVVIAGRRGWVVKTKRSA